MAVPRNSAPLSTKLCFARTIDFVGAPGRTRTSTMLPPPDFESGASTNSATGAVRSQANIAAADHTGARHSVNWIACVGIDITRLGDYLRGRRGKPFRRTHNW